MLFHSEQLENLDSRILSFPLFSKEKSSKKNRIQVDQKDIAIKSQEKQDIVQLQGMELNKFPFLSSISREDKYNLEWF